MNVKAVRSAMRAARNCAMVMVESATYIRGELSKVHLSPALRVETERVCADLVGTKHDVISEMADLDQLLGSKTSDETIAARFDRMVRWLDEDVDKMHALVTALEARSNQQAEYTAAYILIAESAANVRRAFARTREAAESIH